MSKKKKTATGKNRIWLGAQKKYHLSDNHIQMAKELEMNPQKFGGLANTKQESWKAPLPDFIEQVYFKRFGKSRPEEGKHGETVKPKEQLEKEEAGSE